MHRLKLISLTLCLFLVGLLFAAPQPAAAHPADMNFQQHVITIENSTLSVQWSLSPGSALIPTLWDNADLDDDNLVSNDEAELWLGQYIDYYFVEIDQDEIVPARVEAVTFPSNPQALWVGKQSILMQLAFTSDAIQPGAEIHFTNGIEVSRSSNWYTLTANGDLRFDSVTHVDNHLTFTLTDAGDGLTAWDSGQLTGSARIANMPEQSGPASRLTQLISEGENTTWFYATALFISILLGAVHALTPGHGKAMVGAYLVGSRGTPQHAVVLGAIVTLTHTGSVIAFGILALTATQLLAPTTALPLLEMISGALIIVFGLVILRQRWIGYTAVQRYQTAPTPRLVPAAAGAQSGKTISVGKSISVDKPIVTQSAADSISWKSLAGLGISGGLVPCPDAVAILLVATAINRLVLGLTMTVAFSLGLSLVLIAVGLAMVRGRSLIQRFEAFERYTPLLPLISAGVVILLGLILVAKNANKVDALGEAPLIQQAIATLDIIDRRVDVLYLSAENGQLVGVDLNSGRIETVTDSSTILTSVETSPDYKQVAYSTKIDGVDGIYLLDITNRDPVPEQLLACIEALCRVSSWHPSGESLLIEWYDQSDPSRPLVSQTRTLDIETGHVQPLFANSAIAVARAHTSQSGDWLAYVIPGATQLRVQSYDDGQQFQLTNAAQDVVAWHPSRDLLLYTDFLEGTGLSHLYQLNPTTGDIVNLTESESSEDMLAAWSPDGLSIAVVRREIGASTDELWLLRANGSGARLLNAPEGGRHFEPSWSADSQYVLVSWFVSSRNAFEIAIIDVESGEIALERSGVYSPVWVD